MKGITTPCKYKPGEYDRSVVINRYRVINLSPRKLRIVYRSLAIDTRGSRNSSAFAELLKRSPISLERDLRLYFYLCKLPPSCISSLALTSREMHNLYRRKQLAGGTGVRTRCSENDLDVKEAYSAAVRVLKGVAR